MKCTAVHAEPLNPAKSDVPNPFNKALKAPFLFFRGCVFLFFFAVGRRRRAPDSAYGDPTAHGRSGALFVGLLRSGV